MRSNYAIAMNIKVAVSLGFENKLKNMRKIDTKHGIEEPLIS